jgi:hypothetical protein
VHVGRNSNRYRSDSGTLGSLMPERQYPLTISHLAPNIGVGSSLATMRDSSRISHQIGARSQVVALSATAETSPNVVEAVATTSNVTSTKKSFRPPMYDPLEKRFSFFSPNDVPRAGFGVRFLGMRQWEYMKDGSFNSDCCPCLGPRKDAFGKKNRDLG